MTRSSPRPTSRRPAPSRGRPGRRSGVGSASGSRKRSGTGTSRMSADCPSARTPSLPRSAAPRPNSTRGRSLPWRATWSSMRCRAPSPASPTSWAATSGARATRRHKAVSTPTRSRRTSHAAVPSWQDRMPSTRVRSTWCRSSSTTSTSGCTTSTSRPTTSPALCSASRRTCRPCRDKRGGEDAKRLLLCTSMYHVSLSARALQEKYA
mmetsp:Transcript_24448/g.78919  ORF Transcript_24448/g.78919 Transcript_24448/m.78919 type:complete len:208 (+) Transcript_24448:513-1136(+)